MKTIKRVIYVDTLQDLDFENIGVHFTSDLGYSHKGGGSNGGTKEKEYKVTIFCKQYKVNEEATAISNEGYPNENEVVLEFNQELTAEIKVSKINSFGYGRAEQSERKINIGTRCDLWVEKL